MSYPYLIPDSDVHFVVGLQHRSHDEEGALPPPLPSSS